MKTQDTRKPTWGATSTTIELLTTAETAELLRVSRRTIEELGKSYDRALTNSEGGNPTALIPENRLTPDLDHHTEAFLPQKRCRRIPKKYTS